ncbi:citrate lyase holo-[acyl-carrier protein] synthase [Clostridium sp. CT7]|uniref:citrate lyase holo-[acyl-carrier protein] synthase n=1 Tax=Clostridium sp. CT7 TaxID=2052574 RepID=UPI0012FE1598|nr:citrate lyase holo-[acyl-carrier protein] synthase [Clostridium sp. CT7]
MLQQNKSKAALEKFLIDKYKMVLLVASVNYTGINGNRYLIDKIIDRMYHVISQRFIKNIALKIIKVMEEGPVIFVVIDSDAEGVIKEIDAIKKDGLLSSYMNVKIINKDNNIVYCEDLLDR